MESVVAARAESPPEVGDEIAGPVGWPKVAHGTRIDDDDATTRHPVTGTLRNSRGGVRTPVIDAPVEHLTGEPDRDAQPMCMLLGRTLEVDEQELRDRWESRAQYLAAYAEATDRLIAEGFLLADDREEILADARPERITW